MKKIKSGKNANTQNLTVNQIITGADYFKLDIDEYIYFTFLDMQNNLQRIITQVASNQDTTDGLNIRLKSREFTFDNLVIEGKIEQKGNHYFFIANFGYGGYWYHFSGSSNQHSNDRKRMIFGRFTRTRVGSPGGDNGGYGGGNNEN